MLTKIWLTISFLLVSLIISVKFFGDVYVHKTVVNTVKVLFPLLLIAEFLVTLIIIWQ